MLLINWQAKITEETLKKLGTKPRDFVYGKEPYEIGDIIGHVIVEVEDPDKPMIIDGEKVIIDGKEMPSISLHITSIKLKHEKRFRIDYEHYISGSTIRWKKRIETSEDQ